MNDKYSSSYKPTIGADFLSKEIIIEDNIVTFQVWDTAGQERYQSLGAAFYKGSDGCILVYDICDSKSFDSLTKWKEEFISQITHKDTDKFPFILIGNKVDKELDRKISNAQALTWCKQFDSLNYYETSAKENVKVKECFEQICKQAFQFQAMKLN